MRRVVAVWVFSALSGVAWADPPAGRTVALENFHAYAAAAEARMREYPAFLRLAAEQGARAKLQAGAVLTRSARLGGNAPPAVTSAGEIQHWIGAVFAPGVTLAGALPLLEDYSNRARFMAPEITESSVLEQSGDVRLVHLRLAEKSIVPATFDARLRIAWRRPDEYSLAIDSRSESIEDITPSAHGRDRGLLWALNHYWRIADMDGGLYIECEALALSRRPPAMIRFLAEPMIGRASRKTLANLLLATKRMVETTLTRQDAASW